MKVVPNSAAKKVLRVTWPFFRGGRSLKRALAVGLAAVLAALVTAAVLVLANPAYLTTLLSWNGGYYDGHFARYWIRTLNSPDDLVRYRAIHALGAIGPAAAEAVPALTTIVLENRKRGLRIEASLALSNMGREAAAAVPALAQALHDEEPIVRMNAALALSRLRAAARPAIPALIQALQEKQNQPTLVLFNLTVQEMAALALGRASAGSAEAVPALEKALRAADSGRMRRAAARALGEVGAEARPAAPLLRALLQDEDEEVRQAGAEALQNIGEDPAGPS
jgi:HEAT repeat protein